MLKKMVVLRKIVARWIDIVERFWIRLQYCTSARVKIVVQFVWISNIISSLLDPFLGRVCETHRNQMRELLGNIETKS